MGIFDKIPRLPNLNEMTGSMGEWLTHHWAKLMTDGIMIPDVLIDSENGNTTQIDLVMIGTKGVYVTEVKMFGDAKIYGDGNKNTWYYYLGGKRYDIYSPLKQNEKHREYLKAFLRDFGDIPFFSLVVMICADMKISNVNKEDGRRDTVVCTSLPAMLRAIQFLAEGREPVLTEEKKEEIAAYIRENQRLGKEERKAHKERVVQFKTGREEQTEQNHCPYCKVPLVRRKGKYGDFYGCPNYPKCRYTKKI